MPPRIGIAGSACKLSACPNRRLKDPVSEDLMNNGKLRIVGCLAGLAGVLVCGNAFAQDATPAAAAPAAPPQPAPAADASASTSGSAQVGMALPGAAPQAAQAVAVAGNSDHDAVVGRLAVGYLGRNGIDIGAGALPGAANVVIDAPVIGVRYWLSDMLGIDAGLGFGVASSSSENAAGMEADGPSYHAFILHGGVPLSLASAGHFSFQVVPEANIGFAGTGDYDIAGGTQSDSGFLLNIGARAGAEIQFGFMGIPQLSLQGSVGLYLQQQSGSTTITPTGAGDQSTSDSTFSIGTTLGPDPWDIFTSSISALYYF